MSFYRHIYINEMSQRQVAWHFPFIWEMLERKLCRCCCCCCNYYIKLAKSQWTHSSSRAVFEEGKYIYFLFEMFCAIFVIKHNGMYTMILTKNTDGEGRIWLADGQTAGRIRRRSINYECETTTHFIERIFMACCGRKKCIFVLSII